MCLPVATNEAAQFFFVQHSTSDPEVDAECAMIVQFLVNCKMYIFQ